MGSSFSSAPLPHPLQAQRPFSLTRSHESGVEPTEDHQEGRGCTYDSLQVLSLSLSLSSHANLEHTIIEHALNKERISLFDLGCV